MSLQPFPFLVARPATWIWCVVIGTDLMHVSTELFIISEYFTFWPWKAFWLSLQCQHFVPAPVSCSSFNNRFFCWKQSFLINSASPIILISIPPLIPVGHAYLMPEFWKPKPLKWWLCGIIKTEWDHFSFEVNYFCIQKHVSKWQNVRSQMRPCCFSGQVYADI
jgi:hypothetical protein